LTKKAPWKIDDFPGGKQKRNTNQHRKYTMNAQKMLITYLAASATSAATGLIAADLANRIGFNVPPIIAIEGTWIIAVGVPTMYVAGDSVLRALGKRPAPPWKNARRDLSREIAHRPSWVTSIKQILGLEPMPTRQPISVSRDRGVSSRLFEFILGPARPPQLVTSARARSNAQTDDPFTERHTWLEFEYISVDADGIPHTFREDELADFLRRAWRWRNRRPWSRKRHLATDIRLTRREYDAIMTLLLSVNSIVYDRDQNRSGKIKLPPGACLHIVRKRRGRQILV
jgi:hypothetical protein